MHIGKCRLCQKDDVELKSSHIVSKMFYNVIKKQSETGYLREVNNPNKSLQDGLKTPFMCSECEELFSKYETFFSNNYYQNIVSNKGDCNINSKDDNIRYLLLSISWRIMQHTMESNDYDLSEEEIKFVKETIENWRTILITENMKNIRQIQQFIIPTKNIPFFTGIESRIWNNIGMDFKTLDRKNEFKYSAVVTQVPYLIIVTSVWGKTDSMKQFLVGKTIKPQRSQLPKLINDILYNHHNTMFFEALNNMSDTQKEIIMKRAKHNE